MARKLLANLGDVNFVEYGGSIVFEDIDGCIYLENYNPETGEVYTLEPDKLWEHEGHLLFQNPAASRALPYPLKRYTAWFDGYLQSISATVGMGIEGLRSLLTNENVKVRARGYECVAQTLGWFEFEQYPLHLTQEQAARRYAFVK
jgi:hypothetical protein